MGESTTKLRQLWKTFECDETKMVVVPFGPDRIRVAPPTAPAWDALASIFRYHRYDIRTTDTDSYNCRTIKGTTQKSLHSYGIALDINWNTNPFRETPDKRKVRFSDKPTQAERGEDVRLGKADTDMTPDLIADALAIKTTNGKQVLEWGGSWASVKDAMHFEIDLAPDDLTAGIDTTTVLGGGSSADVDTEMPLSTPTPLATTPITPSAADPHVVIARDGLKLRTGPGTEFSSKRTFPAGTTVNVLAREGQWALVDLQGDGMADGFMNLGFLRAVAEGGGASLQPVSVASGSDILGLVTVDLVVQLFPTATRRSNITANLPFVLAGLRARSLSDRPMILMALATIRAETEGFVPIGEGRSEHNTRITPFDRYDVGTSKGQELGNTIQGDGPRFKGRGYIQLTGRSNYTVVGRQIGADLVGNPERANDPMTAGLILAQFLKNKEGAIRMALATDDLRQARKLINGGSHGFDRFRDTYERGLRILPA